MTNENVMPQAPSFICVGDLQKLMGISRASAYALVKKKGFPSITVGNRIVIPCDLFNDWVAKSAGGRC
jgi:predicted DNA-binding transcriptional regulator AlpA